jgi:hypothetical protein
VLDSLCKDCIIDNNAIHQILEAQNIANVEQERISNMTSLPEHPERIVKRVEPDYKKLRPMLGWIKADQIRRTFESSTQMGRMPAGEHLYRQYKSPNPAFNEHNRRSEPVATDTIFSDTPVVDDSSTIAQLYFGMESKVTDVIAMKMEKQFVNTLEDIIRKWGAPTKLISNRAQVEISKRALDILRALQIGDWQSQPNQQWQNPAERRYQNKTKQIKVFLRLSLYCLKTSKVKEQ